ncbi:efflux RND transporter permease subunit [Vibrio sp. FNV 38]|nr:efflux RND transporter permease subunit [Vibrio sp. FNV 38]
MKHNKGPIAWMVNNGVTPNLLMLVFIIGGLLMSMQIRKEVYPSYPQNSIRISVSYSGSTPTEMEQGVTLPIENAITDIEGIKEIHSRVNASNSRVTADLMNGVNVESVLREIESAVNGATLPDGAETPRIYRYERRNESFELVLHGDVDPVALRETSTEIKNILLGSSELTQVEVVGFSKYEVQVEVDSETLRFYDLGLDDIATSISRHAINQSGGKLETDGGEVLVQLDESRNWADDFNDVIVVQTATGSSLMLEDIATITDGFADQRNRFFYNGQPSASLRIYRLGDQTPASISEAVYDLMPDIEASLQPGITLDVVNDDAVIYQQRMSLLLENAFFGLILVLILLALFLDVRLAFWVTIGIPTAFLGSLLFLPIFDVSINMISMFAFIIALGIVVDDAIIAGENIHAKMGEGMGFFNAAIEGARSISVPLTFSILTNIVAFIPIWFLPGTLGLTFKVIPVVVICVFVISWIEALFILPAHLAHIKHRPELKGLKAFSKLQSLFDRGLQRLIFHYYLSMLKHLLTHRYLVTAVAVATLTVSLSYVLGGHLGFTTMPRVESEYSTARAYVQTGTSDEAIYSVKHQLESAAMDIIESHGGQSLAKGISTQIRNRDGQLAIITRIFLVPSEERSLSTRDVSKLWRDKVGDVHEVNSLRFSAAGSGSGDDVSGVTVEMSHRDNRILKQASEELATMLGNYAGVVDIENSFMSGSQQVKLSLRAEGKSMGQTEQTLIRQVRNAFSGARAIRQQRGSDEVDVMVKLPDWQRSSLYHLEQLPIKVGNVTVPLIEIANIEPEYSASQIQRHNGKRHVTVSADITPASEAMTLTQTLSREAFPLLKSTYPGLEISFGGDQAEQKESLDSLTINGLLVALALYCLLAVPLRSYTQPLLIMSIIPFGIIGAIMGHVLLGYTLSVVSLLGVLALSGVVINDSLILLAEINRNRASGIDLVTSSIRGSTRRFRPIILTTLTTFGGLAPMMLETSNQAQLMVPMAISLGFGIVFATLLTLVLLPCLYLILEDIKYLYGGKATEKQLIEG